jgi:hypothetical protein
MDSAIQGALDATTVAYQHLFEKAPKITTMTMSFYTKEVAEWSRLPSHPNIRISPMRFANCRLIKFVDSPVAIKLFVNGTLHVTGTRTMDQANDIVESLCGLLDPVPVIERRSVELINVVAALKRPSADRLWNLPYLQTAFADKGVVSILQQDRHAGLMVKYICQTGQVVSVIIFDKGPLMIHAFRNVEEWTEASTFVLSVLVKQDPRMFTEAIPLPKATNKSFDYAKYLELR